MSTSKMDRQGSRTPAQTEQRYSFGKKFAEAFGLAEDAMEAAEQAQKNATNAADELDKKLTPEELFNRLTNNGQAQGLYRDEDGNIYINASYLASGIISSKDGKIQINLGDKNGPVFNSGITTNGLQVRDPNDGSLLLDAFASDHVAETTGLPALLFRAFSGDGDMKIYCTDTYQVANGVYTPVGMQFRVFNKAKTRIAEIISLAGKAGFRLNTATREDGDTGIVGLFEVSADGKSVLNCNQINPGKKVLYTGTVSAGATVTVPNTADYDLFAVKLGTSSATESTVVLAYKDGTTIRGVGGWAGTSSQSKELFFLSATFSGNTWTLVDANKQSLGASGSVGTATSLNVKEVIGVI